ncbi:MAG: ISNCY family transposase [Actinomycetota bacterium]|nr:ISNCY family transposase [Actinomycetota bacterium]
MSEVELMRAEVCVRVVSGEFNVAEAALRLALSYRQMKRLLRRYRKRGAAGLVHGSLGRSSNRARPLAEIRARALDLIRAHYSGPPDERFGPRLAAEHLESDHGIKVCPETLRLWMLDAGLWSLSRRRKPYRQRRERRAHFGELVQADGSFHGWLEDRGPKGWLITYVDDSRSESLARFADAESTWAVAEVLEEWIMEYGIPKALYVDGGGAFGSQGRRKSVGSTQFGRMCKQLGIHLIHARSPQAKGRVERAHGTHQDRLIKKMRLAGISNYADANRFLKNYLIDHNRRYSVPSRDEANFHLPLSGSLDLSRVFSIHSERRVSLDSVVCYDRRRFQLTRTTRLVAGQKVSVEELRDGSVRIFASGIELSWTEITDNVLMQTGEPVRDHNSVNRRPTDNHPWRYPGYDRATAEEKRRQRVMSFQTPPAEQSEVPITT